MNFQLPDLGEGICEAELVEWLVTVGETVEHGQSLAEVMTDKATLEVPAPFSGTITELQAEPGDQLKVGQVILCYESSAEVQPALLQAATTKQAKKGNGRKLQTATPVVRSAVTSSVCAAPSVRRMARQMGLDLARVHGSGPAGRILIDDLASQVQSPESLTQTATEFHAHSQREVFQPGSRVKLRGIRRTTATHMIESKHTIPHYSYVDECDVTELVRLRKSLKESMATRNVKLTFLPFFVKAVVAALREVPIVNSSLDDTAGEIVLHDHFHIGIATDTPRGLLVPVLHNADKLEFVDTARQLDRLTTEARDGKICRDDLLGGTFTITSIGSLGGLISTPIINHPEAAILGIGKIVKRPVYDDAGNLHPADMVYLSLSFDHRIIDGASAAVFCNAIIRHLSNPAELLLTDAILPGRSASSCI